MSGVYASLADSYWVSSTREPEFRALQGDVYASVVVVGGGIVGLTTALLLKRAGLAVAVLEAGPLAGGASGHTRLES